MGIVCIFLLYMNQGGFYSIKGEELENTFLWDIEQRHNFTNGSVIDKQNYKNSITLFYEGECGNIAVTTYIKSFYSDKWKEVWTMTWNKDMGDYDFSIVTNDHIYAYATTYYVKQGKFSVEFEDVRIPEVLLSRLCGFASIIVCSLIGNKLAHVLKIDKKSRMNKK